MEKSLKHKTRTELQKMSAKGLFLIYSDVNLVIKSHLVVTFIRVDGPSVLQHLHHVYEALSVTLSVNCQ